MADGFTADVEADELIRAIDTLGDFAQPYINEASLDSADSIDHEASSRLNRQLTGGYSTGKTEAGIQVEPARDGNGYVVVASRDPLPNLPLWIEKGTKKGDPGSSTQPARPFFGVSAELEKGAHRRRIAEALQDAIDDRGLGE